MGTDLFVRHLVVLSCSIRLYIWPYGVCVWVYARGSHSRKFKDNMFNNSIGLRKRWPVSMQSLMETHTDVCELVSEWVNGRTSVWYAFGRLAGMDLRARDPSHMFSVYWLTWRLNEVHVCVYTMASYWRSIRFMLLE